MMPSWMQFQCFTGWGGSNGWAAVSQTHCSQDKQAIKHTLEEEARRCQRLVLWLDFDREGENIAYEVIGVCTGLWTCVS